MSQRNIPSVQELFRIEELTQRQQRIAVAEWRIWNYNNRDLNHLQLNLIIAGLKNEFFRNMILRLIDLKQQELDQQQKKKQKQISICKDRIKINNYIILIKNYDKNNQYLTDKTKSFEKSYDKTNENQIDKIISFQKYYNQTNKDQIDKTIQKDIKQNKMQRWNFFNCIKSILPFSLSKQQSGDAANCPQFQTSSKSSQQRNSLNNQKFKKNFQQQSSKQQNRIVFQQQTSSLLLNQQKVDQNCQNTHQAFIQEQKQKLE